MLERDQVVTAARRNEINEPYECGHNQTDKEDGEHPQTVGKVEQSS